MIDDITTKMNDESTAEIAYQPISGFYQRIFGMKWSIPKIIKKFDMLYFGVQDIVNDYGRKYPEGEIKTVILYSGLHNVSIKPEPYTYEKSKEIIREMPKGKKSLENYAIEFETTDNKVHLTLDYRGHCPFDLEGGDIWGVGITLKVDGFTENNREEYNRLYELIRYGRNSK